MSKKKCPYCNQLMNVIILDGKEIHHSVDNLKKLPFTLYSCTHCGLFSHLVKRRNTVDFENDLGRYKFICTYNPYGFANVVFKDNTVYSIAIDKSSVESFIDNLIYNLKDIYSIKLSYKENNEVKELNLLELLK